MRVVAGIYRHRELVMPKGELTRPTKDMVREALFSALGNKVNDSVILDLFAGSGALAFEAISRGAKFAYLVDNNKDALNAIKTNLVNLKISNAKIFPFDYQIAIKQLIDERVIIDIIFLDPPYKMNSYQTMIDLLNPILNKHHVIVVESDHKININGDYQKVKDYRYGKTWVTILWK